MWEVQVGFPVLEQEQAKQIGKLSQLKKYFSTWSELLINEGMCAACRETSEHGFPLGVMVFSVLGEICITSELTNPITQRSVSSGGEIFDVSYQRLQCFLREDRELSMAQSTQGFLLAVQRVESIKDVFYSIDTQDVDELVVGVDLFLWERDALQLALIGAKGLEMECPVVGQIASLDHVYRTRLETIRGRIKEIKGLGGLGAQKIPWLPKEFWWRM